MISKFWFYVGLNLPVPVDHNQMIRQNKTLCCWLLHMSMHLDLILEHLGMSKRHMPYVQAKFRWIIKKLSSQMKTKLLWLALKKTIFNVVTFSMLVIVHFWGTHPQFSRHTISGVGIPIAVQFIVIVSNRLSSIRFGGLTTMVGESRRRYQCKFILIWNDLNLLFIIYF